jgi:hypothetical protein
MVTYGTNTLNSKYRDGETNKYQCNFREKCHNFFGQVTKQLLFQFWQIQTRHHKMTVEKTFSVLVTKYQAVTLIVKGSD